MKTIELPKQISVLVILTLFCLASVSCTQSNKDTAPSKSAPTTAPIAQNEEAASPRPKTGPQIFEIKLGKNGFEPAQVHAVTRSAVKLNFTRTAELECGETVFIESMHTQKTIPLNSSESVIFVPELPMKVEFTCGNKDQKGFFNGFVVVKEAPEQLNRVQ